MDKDFLNHCQKIIRQNGGRITQTKLAVIKLLAQGHKPLSPYKIAEKIKNIDVVTVYRILDSFQELNLVHKTDDGFVQCSHFECTEKSHCHHQFSCQKCQQVKEIHIDDQRFLASIGKRFQELHIVSHQFHFSGLCQKCQR